MECKPCIPNDSKKFYIMKLNGIKGATLRLIENDTDFAALREKWQELLNRSYSNVLSLTHSWMVNWWQSFHADNKLHIIIVADENGEIIAIAPMMLNVYNLRGKKLRRIGFMINGHTPYADFIVDSNQATVGIEIIMRYLVTFEKWDIIDFNKLQRDKITHERIKEFATREGYPFGIKKSLEVPYIEIDRDWEAFCQARTPKYRKGIRNKLNRIHKAGEVKIDALPVRNGHKALIQDMCKISEQSWKGKNSRDILSIPGAERFLNGLCEDFGRDGHATVWFLNFEGTPIAFEFHLHYNNTTFPLRADFDDNFKHLSPGSILEYSILQKIFIDHSFNEYDSCGHSYNYLMKLTDKTRKLVKIEIFNKNLPSYMLHGIEYRIIPTLRKLRGFFLERQQ